MMPVDTLISLIDSVKVNEKIGEKDVRLSAMREDAAFEAMSALLGYGEEIQDLRNASRQIDRMEIPAIHSAAFEALISEGDRLADRVAHDSSSREFVAMADAATKLQSTGQEPYTNETVQKILLKRFATAAEKLESYLKPK